MLAFNEQHTTTNLHKLQRCIICLIILPNSRRKYAFPRPKPTSYELNLYKRRSPESTGIKAKRAIGL
ncbi:hypothetical protein GQ602_000571 [Ophiocordyceps camponoti-floridani]|uniref:Uncharacterized protein n=1 Tax=Ophiocordyceps camponoti-floridani TaxID=2030778 RepID=A0A8H4VGF0_9HYPO|nr:hypothetical protein GQ602_000571 [Ophiocordyceps camponoti-floridani]